MKEQNTSNTAQAMWLGIGSLCSFMFAIVSSAVLSRYLTKDEYGTYKQVMYVYTTLQSVFTLGLPLAYSYFLPRVSKEEGRTLTSKLDLAFLVLGAVFSLVLFFGADIIADILKNPDLASNLRIFSPSPILILPTMGLNGVLATYKKTVWNAIYVICTRVLMLLFVAMPVAFYRADCEVAIWGFVIASFISLVIAFIIEKLPFIGVKKEPCTVTYRDIFKYSIPLMVAGLLGVAINAADQFYVSRFYGQEVFADFANGSLELPFVSMVLSAGATVLLPTFSRMISNGEDKNNIVDLWKRTAVKSAYIIYPLVVFFWFFAKDTMTFLYGDKYIESAIYFRIMLIVNFFTVIPFYPIILALGKTKVYARNHFIILVTVWSLEFLSVKILNTPYAITAINVFCRILKIWLMFKVVTDTLHISMLKLLPLRNLLTVALSCMASGFIAWLVVQFIPISQIQILSLSIGFVIFVGLVLLMSKPLKIDYFELLRPVLSKFIKK